MKVLLAGYNLDIDTIQEAKTKGIDPDFLTPESISAAYARISRSPKSVVELRHIARNEVESARKSNRNIIFKMGHHSVAEHAVFNFDVMGISRLAAEEIEHFRLCSFTEKSQRYVKLKDDFVIPPEIESTDKKQLFIDTIKQQNTLYHELFASLKDYVFETNQELAADPKNKSLLEGWAKEDARYTTSLATETQLGHTINARNLELLLRRFASHPLREINNLGREFYKVVSNIAPSIILFTEASDHDKLKLTDLDPIVSNIKNLSSTQQETTNPDDVKLLNSNPNGDTLTCAALLHSASDLSFSDCMKFVSNLNEEGRIKIFKTACQNMEFYDSPHREFEYPELTFELIISASNFAQLKRHRMATLTVQPYKPELGVTIPPAIKAVGKERPFLDLMEKVNDAHEKLAKESPLAAQYILTNAHRRRVLLKVNTRELYHISRLREDSHAQWDIRDTSIKMSKLAKEVMPLTMMLIGGKDSYPEIYEKVYGRPPKVPIPK